VNPLLLAIPGFNLAATKLIEDDERRTIFNAARNHANTLNQPLVNYGCGTKQPYANQSDINLDCTPRNVPRFTLIPRDGRIPLPNNSAIIYAAHVLEHVDNPEKVLKEMTRVGPTYIALPKWYNLSNWVHPNHKRIFTSGNPIENPLSFTLPIIAGTILLLLA